MAIRRQLREATPGFGLGLLAALLMIGASATAPWRTIEGRAESSALALHPRPWNDGVVVIGVDDATDRKLSLPLKRDVDAKIVQELLDAGAKVIADERLLHVPAPDSPQGDLTLAGVAAKSGGKVLLALGCDPKLTADPGGLPLLFAHAYPGGLTPAPACDGLLAPYVLLATTPVGALPAAPQPGRGVLGLVDLLGRRVPALGIAAFLAGESNRALAQRRDSLGLGALELPVAKDGTVLVSARARPDEAHLLSLFDFEVAATRFEGPSLPPRLASAVRGRYVFIGNTSSDLNDFVLLPDGEVGPRVLLHADLLQDLLEAAPIREVAPGPCALLLLLAALIASGLAMWLKPAIAAAAVALEGLSLYGLTTLLAGSGLLLPPLALLTGMLLAFAAALVGRLIVLERSQRMVREAFDGYVDGPALRRILETPERFLSVGGARREVTVLTSELHGYTSTALEHPAEEMFAFLRECAAVMARVVRETGGRVERLSGDRLVAVFGDPIAEPEHASAAVEAGWKLQLALSEVRKRWASAGQSELFVKVGIASGFAYVGDLAANGRRLAYAVLGPTVTLASRLEGKAPHGGVLVSERTYAAARARYEFQPVPRLRLKGFHDEYLAFLVVGPKAVNRGRRSSGRIAVQAEIELIVRGRTLRAKVKNASATGLLVSCDGGPLVGEEIELRWVTEDGESATQRGRVEREGGSGRRRELGIALIAEPKVRAG